MIPCRVSGVGIMGMRRRPGSQTLLLWGVRSFPALPSLLARDPAGRLRVLGGRCARLVGQRRAEQFTA